MDYHKPVFVWVRLIQDKASSALFLEWFGSGNEAQQSSASSEGGGVWSPPAGTPGPDTILLLCGVLALVLMMADDGYLMDCRDSGQRESWLWLVVCPRADGQIPRE